MSCIFSDNRNLQYIEIIINCMQQKENDTLHFYACAYLQFAISLELQYSFIKFTTGIQGHVSDINLRTY